MGIFGFDPRGWLDGVTPLVELLIIFAFSSMISSAFSRFGPERTAKRIWLFIGFQFLFGAREAILEDGGFRDPGMVHEARKMREGDSLEAIEIILSVYMAIPHENFTHRRR
jgi:hypothetical protein